MWWDCFPRGTVFHVQTDTFWAFLRTYSWPSQKHLNNFLFVKVPVAISHYSYFVRVDFGERLIFRKQREVMMASSCTASTSSHGRNSLICSSFLYKLMLSKRIPMGNRILTSIVNAVFSSSSYQLLLGA